VVVEGDKRISKLRAVIYDFLNAIHRDRDKMADFSRGKSYDEEVEQTPKHSTACHKGRMSQKFY
jgi:hypothetical protein